MTKNDGYEPQGPPPAWIADFRKDLRQALADTADDQSPEFDPPEGASIADSAAPDHVQAIFLTKREPMKRDGGNV